MAISPICFFTQANLSFKAVAAKFEKTHCKITNVGMFVKTEDTKDVVIICFDHNQIAADLVEILVGDLNRKLMPTDYVILEDHPDSIELLNGVPMNFGKCGLLLLQKLSKLTTASDQLKQKGYYDSWSAESLDYVVSWRHR